MQTLVHRLIGHVLRGEGLLVAPHELGHGVAGSNAAVDLQYPVGVGREAHLELGVHSFPLPFHGLLLHEGGHKELGESVQTLSNMLSK